MEREHGWAPAIGAACVAAFLVFLGTAIAFGPNFVSAFLSGPAAGWVQAIGSFVAVRWQAEDSHKKQLKALAQGEVDRKIRLITVMKAIFEQIAVLDQSMLKLRQHGITGSNLERLANDSLSRLNQVPLFELPDADLIKLVSLSRQSVGTYCEIFAANRRVAPVDIDRELFRLKNFVELATETTKECVKHCDDLIAKFEREAS